MGYSEAIYSVVEKHGWQIFCFHLDDVLTKKDNDDVTQATTPADTTTTLTIALMTEQECATHQLIDDLMKSDIDDEEEVPINQLKWKYYKQTTGKSIQDDAGEIKRKQR
ncbi:hypothetical protein PVK06_035179 [Gossypium arboreum]|uniref:Uncharacterized protein n=1 Tax=Gossypium arboreum TaxID=29729 RepID=A0ABR0NG52_GOSAR|nr:hypothetical protein PVK06_035179 [Gossypium arboreum]